MVAATLSALGESGGVAEISKRDIWSVPLAAADRLDVGYGMVALDFLPSCMLAKELTQLACAAAKGQVRPLPMQLHTLGLAPVAMRHMMQAQHVGKMVVR